MARVSGFNVVAFMCAFNESDVVYHSIKHLVDQGIRVYFIDNESTDRTAEIARGWVGRGLVGFETFDLPIKNGKKFYSLRMALRRIEQLCSEMGADWYLVNDADEFRYSPWAEFNLIQAIRKVDLAGYTCINFDVFEFHPTDNSFEPGEDVRKCLRYYELNPKPGHLVQFKCWKNTGQLIDLATSGGHDVHFPDRKVFPVKFILHHYPIRSQSHGERKMFFERGPRIDPEDLAAGLNVHYARYERSHNFIQDRKSLKCIDDFRLSSLTFAEPNKYAPAPRLDLLPQAAKFHGYQEFVLTRVSIQALAEDLSLRKKQELLASLFTPRYLGKRTVLDLGANAGFFCFWALQQGATKAIALDMDENYLRMVEEARSKMGIQNLETVQANVEGWTQPADIVLALALVHWIYSCTALFGSLDSAVEKLAQLTRYMLVVEWVDPADPAITFFHHVNWNKEFVGGPYTLDAFESALKSHFARFECVGDVSPTRKLYVAFRVKHEVDFSGSLPLTMPKGTVISRRHLATHDGIQYWSCLYDGGNVIHKQATLDLAEREAQFLSQMSSDFFPKVLDVRSEGGFSVITLEKIDGVPLLESLSDINTDSATMHGFFQQCLDLLCKLEDTGIQHRDIRPENILVRDGKPVLLDFGWAISRERPCVTPQGLGSSERPPDGSFCDVYSMGKVFEQVNQHRHPALDLVIELMVDPDATMRITGLDTLKALFACTAVPVTQEIGQDYE